MTRIFYRLILWKWISCQAVTSVLCLLFHCSTKNKYTSEITFLPLVPWSTVSVAKRTQIFIRRHIWKSKRSWSSQNLLYWRSKDRKHIQHCDLKVPRSQAKIDENFANYFLKTNANNKCLMRLKYTCEGLQKSISMLER